MGRATGLPTLASTSPPSFSHWAALSFTTQSVFVAILLSGSAVVQSWRLGLGLVSTSDTMRTVKPCLIFNVCLKSTGLKNGHLPSSCLGTGGFPQGTGGLSLLSCGRDGSGTWPFGGTFKECHTERVMPSVSITFLHSGTENLWQKKSSKLALKCNATSGQERP